MENNYIRRQVVTIEIPANTSGVVNTEVQVDREYAKCVGVTVYNKGAHTSYDVGLKRKRGAQIEDAIPFEHYEKTNIERSLPSDWMITNDKILVQTSIDIAEANVLKYKIVFTLEK